MKKIFRLLLTTIAMMFLATTIKYVYSSNPNNTENVLAFEVLDMPWASNPDFKIVEHIPETGLLAAGSYQSVKVFASPGTIKTDPLKTFSVDIVIGPVNNLMTFATEVIFDPTVVTVTGTTEGNFLKQNGTVQTTFLKTIDNTNGRCVLAITRLTSPSSGVSSSSNNTVLTLHFKANNPGQTAISLVNTGLIHPNGYTTYDASVTNASVKVLLDPNHSTVSFTPETISVFPEESFNTGVGVKGVNNLFGISVDINYNPELLQINAITEGDFLNESGQVTTAFITNINNEAGKAVVGISRLNTETGVSTVNLANLFNISFSTKQSGITEVHLSNTGLLAPDGITPYAVKSEKLNVQIRSDEAFISGIITNSETGFPVQGVIVKTLNYESSPSDGMGKYLLKVPYGYGYNLTVMSGMFETETISNVHVPSHDPVKEINMQLVPIPIEYGVTRILPDPNPVVSEVMQGGTLHRYYRVINKYNGNPLPLVPVRIVGNNLSKIVESDEKGIIDIPINSNQIGTGVPGSQETFTIISVNNEQIDEPVNFTAKVIARNYSKYWDGQNYLKLGGNLLGFDVGAKLELGGVTKLHVDESLSASPFEMQIDRQGRSTAEIGLKVKSPGLKGQLGPVKGGVGAEAGVGIAFTGLKEDGYIFPYISENDYQKIAKYILIADGNYKLLDNTLIRLLTLCEMLFSDDATLLNATASEAVGIEVTAKAGAEASAGIEVANVIGVGLSAEAGAGANAGIKYKFHHREQLLENSFSLSGQIGIGLSGGVKFPFLEEIEGKVHIYETGLRRGIQISSIHDYSNMQKIKELKLTFISKNPFEKWEEEIEYSISGDQIINAIKNQIDDIAKVVNAQSTGLNVRINSLTFQNLITRLFTLLNDVQTTNSGDASISYRVFRTETTNKASFEIGIDLSATALAGSFGAGTSLDEGISMMVEKGKWAWGKHFTNHIYLNSIPNIPVDYKTLMQTVVNETPWYVRSLMGDFRWIAFWKKSTENDHLISENGSKINLPLSAVPPGVDSLSVTSWSWYGDEPSLKSASLTSTRQSIAETNRAKAEEIYGMQYGIGGFYQFEPYSTELLESCDLTIVYDPSELNGIDENSLGMYWEDKENKRWVYVGGVVDIQNKTVTASVTKLGLFTLAPAMPYGQFGLNADPDRIYADSNTVTTVVSDPIYNNDLSLVPNGTMFTIGLSHGYVQTVDADPFTDGIQVLATNGRLNFQIRSSHLAGIAKVQATSVQGSAYGTTEVVYYDTIAPVMPHILNAVAGDGQVNLKWITNKEDDIAGYIIYYDTDTIAPFNGVHTVYGEPSPIITGIDTIRTIAGLLNDSTYYFAISAYDYSGNESKLSRFVKATPKTDLIPEAITLIVNDPPVNAAIESEGTINWYRFQTGYEGNYTIQTFGSTDTYMELYHNDGITLINSDSNGSDSLNARIVTNLSADSRYYIKVRGNYSSTIGEYAIGVYHGPQITYPSLQGILWYTGTIYEITWKDFTDPYVKIELYKEGSLVRTITSARANTGSMNWRVATTLEAGNDYKIRITSTANPAMTAESVNNFTITMPPQVSYPSATGIVWNPGTIYEITWQDFSDPYVRIELLKGVELVRTIASVRTNTGSMNWKVAALPSGNDYKIRISSTANPAMIAESANFFSIEPLAGAQVTYPSAIGIIWNPGTFYEITWQDFYRPVCAPMNC
jgi:hypothetical protein